MLLERLEHLTKPKITFDSNKDKSNRPLYRKRTAVLRKITEKLNEIDQKIAYQKQAEWNKRDLSEKIKIEEAAISELKATNSLWEQNLHNMEANVQNKKKEASEIRQRIDLLLLKKKQAEIDKENSIIELIKTNEAFLKGCMHYRKKLHIRVDLDQNNGITVQFLKICTSDGTPCSIKLSHRDNMWELEELMQQLTCKNRLAERLQETQDIQGFLVHVRRMFIAKVKDVN